MLRMELNENTMMKHASLLALDSTFKTNGTIDLIAIVKVAPPKWFPRHAPGKCEWSCSCWFGDPDNYSYYGAAARVYIFEGIGSGFSTEELDKKPWYENLSITEPHKYPHQPPAAAKPHAATLPGTCWQAPRGEIAATTFFSEGWCFTCQRAAWWL